MLLLRKESFFRFNRALLLGIMLLSLILPLCNFHALAIEENPIQQGINMIAEPVIITGNADIPAQPADIPASEPFSWLLIAIGIYFAGVIVTFVRKVVQIALLYRAIHTGVLWEEEDNGITIYCHGKDIAPFCWFHSIVISENDYNNNAREILQHEMGHIINHHSLDILLVSLIQIIQWWNPFSWKLETSLRDIHEYEADNAVLSSGINAHHYQLLLIKKAADSSSLAFADSFNHSMLKKRIAMMLKAKSNPWMRTKALYLLPVAAMMLCVFATPELNERVNEIAKEATKIEEAVKKLELTHQPIKEETVAKILKEEQEEEVKEEVTETVVKTEPNDDADWDYYSSGTYDQCSYEEYLERNDYLPEFPKGKNGFLSYVKEHFTKPTELTNKPLDCQVFIVFDINQDGSINGLKNVYIHEPLHSMSSTELAALENEAKRFVSNMPKWNSRKNNNGATHTSYTLSVTLKGEKEKTTRISIKRNEEG